jgi:hypothetical protein
LGSALTVHSSLSSTATLVGHVSDRKSAVAAQVEDVAALILYEVKILERAFL